MRKDNGRHNRSSIFLYASVVGVSLCLTSVSHALIFVSLNSVGYEGSWTKYGSLTDAENGTNSVATGAVPQRDLQMILSQGRSSADEFTMATGWNLGSGNPSNTNEGFLQVQDIGLSTVESLVGGWTDTNFDTYQVNLNGSNALARTPSAGNQEVRLGVGPSDRSTTGTWHFYELDLTFSGVDSNETDPGIQRADDDPSAVSGNLFVIFENPNVLDLDGNPNANLGFYRVDIAINMDSWAVDNGVPAVVDDPAIFEATTTPVPEPSAYSMLTAIFVGLWVLFLRRRSI